ncbi:aromatic amino acid lyase, partial [Pseudoalteromonas sp. 2-MNA-CIBAN-0060]
IKHAESQIAASAQTVQNVINEHRTVYGINTGFGLLANTKIADNELELLQRSIVLSHAAGIGEYMDDSTVRLMIILKINSLSRG